MKTYLASLANCEHNLIYPHIVTMTFHSSGTVTIFSEAECRQVNLTRKGQIFIGSFESKVS